MDKQENEIANLLDNINDSIKSIQANQISTNDVPGTFNMMFSGASNGAIIKFIYDTNLDKLFDQLFDMLMNGDITEILEKCNSLENTLKTFDIGTDKIFNTQVSKQMISVMKQTASSDKFNKQKNNIRKAMMLLRKLKQDAKRVQDKETRKKYNDSIYAFKQILKIMATVYRSRKHINARMEKGIRNMITESVDNCYFDYPVVEILEQ